MISFIDYPVSTVIRNENKEESFKIYLKVIDIRG